MCANEFSQASELSFCVVIPMYNEATGAKKCVRSVCNMLDLLPYRTTLIVVNDGSTDDTEQILKRLTSEFDKLHVLNHDKNLGYGGALKSGARQAAEMDFEYVLFMDSDLTNNPKYLPLFVDKMKKGYDIIKASRYMKGGGVYGVPAWRVIISRAGNIIARLLYGLPIHDCTNGFRAIRTDVFNQMQLRENRFSIIMEELYYVKLNNCTLSEIPNTLTNRGSEQRPTSFSYGPSSFYRYLKYPIKASLQVKHNTHTTR